MQIESRLARMVAQTQAQARIPALSAALHRTDRPLWTSTVGTSGRPGAPLTERTLFRVGSITKTFTAVLVLQCRDDGLLDLDDQIGAHLKVPAHGDLTVRRLLSHTAGLQREPYGDVWDTLLAPDTNRLIGDLAKAERVLAPQRRYHYSNLGLSLLGYLVAVLRGGTWAEVLADRITGPLGLADVVVEPGERAAVGYLVDAYSDHARPEPAGDFGALAPAAQLWSTAADLAKWAAFLADPASVDPTGAVLRPATIEEMRTPLTVTDDALWAVGFGLGLMLAPQPARVVHVGHDGAMPGFLAAAYGRVGGAGTPRACGAAVLGSSGTAIETVELPHSLLATSVSEDPADIPPWQPGPPVPEPYRSALGRWWSEGFEYVFSWHRDSLQARRVDDPPGKPPAIFEPIGGDELRTVSGRETGERLRLHRRRGQVVRMHWATYRFTRTQQTFDGAAVGEADQSAQPSPDRAG
jgi:CubicO group peptidase (beta-lactamase class C family)